MASRFAMGVSGLALAGWTWDIELFKRLSPVSVAMNPMTAVGLSLAAVSLELQADPREARPDRGKTRAAAAALAGLAAVIGGLRLLGYVAGWDIGVDRALFAAKLAGGGGELPNRMAPNTSFALLLLGGVLVFLDWRGARLRGLAHAMAVLASLTALLALIGYAYDVPRFYGIFPHIAMAVNTAACFVVRSFGAMLARPDRGLAAVLVSRHSGGVTARRLLPAVVGAPIVLGWLRLAGERRGLYGAELGSALDATVAAGLFAALVVWQAMLLDETDADRERDAESLRRSESRLSHALDLAQAAAISVDDGRRIIAYDERAERIFGHSAREALGRPLDILIPVRLAEEHRRHVADFGAAAETARRMGERSDVCGRRRDGSEFPAEVAISKARENGAWVFTAVVRDVTERKRAEEELRASAARLAAANEELEAFAYSVAHDLRAPLRHIGGFIQLLAKRTGAALDDESGKYLATISESAERMGVLIDDLLAFSRLGRAPMRRNRVDLGALLRAAAKELEPDSGDRRIDWRLSPLPEVEGDPAMLRLVLFNLLSNALKFTRPRRAAVIEVGTLDDGPGRVAVFVRDNGVGFDMRYADKLFGVFQRLHGEDDFEGTGIGLANVRRIIVRHGGRTWAEGTAGGGATFCFSLPAGAKEAAA